MPDNYITTSDGGLTFAVTTGAPIIESSNVIVNGQGSACSGLSISIPADKDFVNDLHNKLVLKPALPKVKEVIFNPPATIVYWTDGSKTVVTCSEDDIFIEETGFALCFLKKCMGNKGAYNTYMRKTLKNAKRYYKEEEKLSKIVSDIFEKLFKPPYPISDKVHTVRGDVMEEFDATKKEFASVYSKKIYEGKKVSTLLPRLTVALKKCIQILKDA